MKWTLVWAAALLTLASVPWIFGQSLPEPTGSAALLMGWIALAVGCKGLPAGKQQLLALALLGILLRLPALVEDPSSSDDLWRYLWEGRVSAAGENPARIPPDSPRLALLRDSRVHPQVNNPSISSIYLPAAQAAFWLTHHLGGTVLAWKLVLTSMELLAGWSLVRHSKSCTAFVLWFLNPILLRESAEAGHIDSLGASFLLLGLSLSGRWASCIAIWVSVLVKPIAAPLAFYTLRDRPKRIPILITGALALSSMAWFIHEPDLQLKTGGRQQLQHFSAQGWQELSVEAIESMVKSEVDLLGTCDEAVQQTLLPALDGLAAITFGPEGGSVIFVSPSAQASALRSSLESQDIIGRYDAIRISPETRAPMHLDFDASQTLRVTDAYGSTELNYYIENGDKVVIFDAATQQRWAVLAVSGKDGHLRGNFSGSEDVPFYAFKSAESPLMGFSQFGDRWTGANFLHDPALQWIGSRRGVRMMAAIGALLMAIAAMLMNWRPPLVALLIACWLIACLPQVHPWYLVWVVPGALMHSAELSPPKMAVGMLLPIIVWTALSLA